MTTKVATTTLMVATHINAPPSATSGQMATPAATPTRAIIQELVASCDAVRLSGAPENEKKRHGFDHVPLQDVGRGRYGGPLS